MLSTVSCQQSAIFSKYLELNKRDVKELVENKAYDLAIKLAKATPVATKAKIKSDVEKLGWGLKRAIMEPHCEAGERILSIIKAQIETAIKRAPGEPKEAPLIRLQSIIIRLRVNARFWMMCGWLPKVYRMRGKGTEREPQLQTNQKRRGEVEIVQRGKNSWNVKITNTTPGIEILNNRTNFVQAGLRAWTDDMLNYIRAKTRGRSGKTVGGF